VNYREPKKPDSKAENGRPKNNFLERVESRLSDILTIIRNKRLWNLKVVSAFCALVIIDVPEPV
jgi:hypothetical protein